MWRFVLYAGKHYHSCSLGPRTSWCRVVYLDRIGCRRCNKKPPGNNTGEHDIFHFLHVPILIDLHQTQISKSVHRINPEVLARWAAESRSEIHWSSCFSNPRYFDISLTKISRKSDFLCNWDTLGCISTEFFFSLPLKNAKADERIHFF